MWTKTKPLLSLLEWAEIIGINPWILAQVGEPSETITPYLEDNVASCARVFYQDASKTSGALAREEIAEALVQAQELVAKVAMTYPAPIELSETILYPRQAHLKYGNVWWGQSGRVKSLRVNYGNMISTGVYEETLIEADVTVVPDDPYADGFDTVWSATVNVPVGTTADEVMVYFASADYYDQSRENMRIYPVKVSISGNVATISGHMTQLVLIGNYLKLAPTKLDATDSIYATEIDVYRRTVDLTASGTLLWESNTYADGIDCPNPPCTTYITAGCFGMTDPVGGWVSPIPAQYDEALAQYTRITPTEYFAPDRVNINYIAGYPLVNGRMASPWNRIVALLATALLPNRTCGCERADLRLFHYRQLPQDDDKNLQVSVDLINVTSGMFGVTGRGAIQAYQLLNNDNLRIYRSAHA